MRERAVPEWLLPISGMPFWRGFLRCAVYGAGGVALVDWLGVWGLLALPLLIVVVWLVEAIAQRVSGVVRAMVRSR